MNKLIRNSTAEFLMFTSSAGEEGIEVKVEDETVWLMQKLIAELFDKLASTVNEYIQNIFEEGELVSGATVKKALTVRQELCS